MWNLSHTMLFWLLYWSFFWESSFVLPVPEDMWGYELRMSNVTTDIEDAYMRQRFRIPFSGATAYIVEFIPKVNLSTAHHMIVRGCSNEAANECTVLYAWANGAPALRFPPGVGIPVGISTMVKELSLELHYLPVVTYPDQSGVLVMFSNRTQPRAAGVLLLLRSEGNIPPHKRHVTLDISCKLPEYSRITIMGMRSHAHHLGRSIVAYRASSYADEPLELIGRGNPQWAHAFYPIHSLGSETGEVDVTYEDILLARCVYDSTGQTRVTKVGSTHKHEMCNAYLMYHSDPADLIPAEMSYCVDDEFPDEWTRVPKDSKDYATPIAPRNSGINSPSFLNLNRSEPIPTVSVPRWLRFADETIGQLISIATIPSGDGGHKLLIIHRSSNPSNLVIDPIIQLNPHTLSIEEKWGSGLFVMPYSITVQYRHSKNTTLPDSVWITDIELNQVFQFTWGQWKKPRLVLGHSSQFCKPTDVAVSSMGDVFVANGYCNSQIFKFSSNGTLLAVWSAGGLSAIDESQQSPSETHITDHKLNKFHLIQSLTMIPPGENGMLEQVCAADQDRATVYCFTTDGVLVARYTGLSMQPSVHSIVYSSKFKRLFGITGQTPNGSRRPFGFLISPIHPSIADAGIFVGKSSAVSGFFAFPTIETPNALSLSPSDNYMYLVDSRSNRIYESDILIFENFENVDKINGSGLRFLEALTEWIPRTLNPSRLIGVIMLTSLMLVITLFLCARFCCCLRVALTSLFVNANGIDLNSTKHLQGSRRWFKLSNRSPSGFEPLVGSDGCYYGPNGSDDDDEEFDEDVILNKALMKPTTIFVDSNSGKIEGGTTVARQPAQLNRPTVSRQKKRISFKISTAQRGGKVA